MSNKKEYSQTTLTNAVKYLIDIIQNEITLNEDTQEYLSRLKIVCNNKNLSKILELDDDKTKELLVKKQIDDKKVQYFNEYSHNLDKLIIFRNFLLILSFLKGIVHKNKNEKVSSTRGILKKLLYRRDSLFRENVSRSDGMDYSRKVDEYEDFIKITKMFSKFLESKNYNKNISINFEPLILAESQVIRSSDRTDDSPVDEDKIKVDRFISKMNVLLSLPVESIRMFFKVSDSSYGNYLIPESLTSFLKYYVSRSSFETVTDMKSVCINGVGVTTLLTRTILEVKNTLKMEDVQVFINDDNAISRQIRQIQYDMISDNSMKFTTVLNKNFIDEDKLTSDVVISIPPTKLTVFQSDRFIANDILKDDILVNGLPLPAEELSSFVYFYKSQEIFNKKFFIVVPLSFITTHSIPNLEDKDKIVKTFQGDLEYDDFRRNKMSEIYLKNEHLKMIIESQQIKKIMLLPKDTMYHTPQQCLLLECSKEQNDGIQFIDSSRKFFQNIEGKIVLNNGRKKDFSTKLKKVYDVYGEDCYVLNSDDKDDGTISEKSDSSTLISKYISYDDIIKNNYNLNPNYYLIDGVEPASATSKELNELFDIFKLQKLPIKAGKESKTIKFYSKEVFSQFGITDLSDHKEEIESIVKLESTKYQKFHKVYDGDVLLYVHYKSRTDITYVSISESDKVEYVGKHNLICLRAKNQDKDLSKSLYMYLISNEGQSQLKSISKRTADNRPLISTEDLKSLKFNLDSVESLNQKFDAMKQQVDKINDDIEELDNIIQ